MQSRTIFIVVGAIVLIAIGTFMYSNRAVAPEQGSDTEIGGSSRDIGENVNGNSATGETTAPVPAPAPAPTPKPGTYTIAQVSTHNTPANCWAAINGTVYNLTAWIAKHPGGEEAILSLCGKDGSSAFNKQHGDQEKPEKTLAGFEVGTLAQ